MVNTDDNLILKNNLFYLTSALSRLLTRQADDVFSTVGLSASHSLILWLVDENPDIQPGILAQKLHLKPSTVTRLVQKLERRGFVERESKGRATSIVCTTEGAKLADDIKQRWKKLINQKRELLGDRYMEVLSEMISNALTAIREEP